MRPFASFQTLSLALMSAISANALLLPSLDPFYTPFDNLSLYNPGDILKSREIQNNLSGLIGNTLLPLSVKHSYQYLYRTTDSLGEPAAAVTTLLVPYHADPSKLLAYQTAYDSANNDCSPSYALRAGANATAATDIVFIAAALDNGWYVVTSDYEGLDAAYVSGVVAGHATLDSVRAAFNEAPSSGLSPSARYAMWGYSGGSLASEWAAELQPSYAPELDFAGVALGGLIPNVTDVLLTINKGIASGLAFSGIYGLSKAYPNVSAVLQTDLLPAKKSEFFQIANGCLGQTAEAGAFMDLFSYFANGEADLTGPVAQSVLAETGQMGTHGVPRAPLFIYKALGDEISPERDTSALVEKLCAKGALIEYHRDLIGEHISEAITGSSSALSWVADRLNGVPVGIKACVTEDVVLTSLNLGTVGELSVELVALLQTLLLGGHTGLAVSG